MGSRSVTGIHRVDAGARVGSFHDALTIVVAVGGALAVDSSSSASLSWCSSSSEEAEDVVAYEDAFWGRVLEVDGEGGGGAGQFQNMRRATTNAASMDHQKVRRICASSCSAWYRSCACSLVASAGGSTEAAAAAAVASETMPPPSAMSADESSRVKSNSILASRMLVSWYRSPPRKFPHPEPWKYLPSVRLLVVVVVRNQCRPPPLPPPLLIPSPPLPMHAGRAKSVPRSRTN